MYIYSLYRQILLCCIQCLHMDNMSMCGRYISKPCVLEFSYTQEQNKSVLMKVVFTDIFFEDHSTHWMQKNILISSLS